jgi:YidC/Oxa1 family membrane protein insertase
MQVSISTAGARPTIIRLKEYQTYRATPLLLADPDSGRFEYRFFIDNKDISTADLHFRPEQLPDGGLRLVAPTTDPAKYLAITYRLDPETYFLHTQLELVGLQREVDLRKLFFRWDLVGLSNEKHRPNELQKSGVYFKYFTDSRDYLSETGDDEKNLVARTNWVAYKQDFFSVAMVRDKGFSGDGSVLAIRELPGPQHTKAYSAKLYFDEPDAEGLLAMRWYLGPNHFGTLRRTGVDELHKVIDLGWGIFGWMNRWLVIPIFNWLDGWGWNYGIIILVLTLAIKLLLMPLTWKNYVSSAKMRALKPEMDAINEKLKDAEPLKKQQATMDLYRKAGVNPVSGCVPMLIQLPVLYAMFRFFPSSIELRQESFLWADDLSSYDSILDLPFEIPFYGAHVSLFTLLMATSTVFYTMLNQKNMPQQQGMPSMKLMMYLFPVMMLFFLNSFSAGLSYYYLLANLISIMQMTVLKRWLIDEDKIRTQLLANMKKPRKKSKWQQRIEDMQKQQQKQLEQRKRRR